MLEVNRFTCESSSYVADPDFQLVRGQLRPVGRIPLYAHRDPILAFLRKELDGKPWISWLVDQVSECDFSSYSRFFASLITRLFSGKGSVVLIDALEACRLTAPTLATVIEHFSDVSDAFQHGSDILKNDGFSPPLNDFGLFEILDGDIPARLKCRIESDGLVLSGGRIPLAEAVSIIRRFPERFSAGAAFETAASG